MIATSSTALFVLLVSTACTIKESEGEGGSGGSDPASTGGSSVGGAGSGGAIGGEAAGGSAMGGVGVGGGGVGGSTGVPFTCGASTCSAGSELCCWDINDTGACVADPTACDWFLYECTSPTHCGDQSLCCALPGLSSDCQPDVGSACDAADTVCDTVADCPDFFGSPATDCAPSTDTALTYNVCVW